MAQPPRKSRTLPTEPLFGTEKQREAYDKAVQAIERARAVNATTLVLSNREGFGELNILPPQLADLATLTSLDLGSTNVSDISHIAKLTALGSITAQC